MKVFHPIEGAMLDLDSLQAVGAGSSRSLFALRDSIWKGASSLVLSGLELKGAAKADALGAVPFTPGSITVTPGTALLSLPGGDSWLIEVPEPLTATMAPGGTAQQFMAVLVAESSPGVGVGELPSAHRLLSAGVAVVDAKKLLPHHVPLAFRPSPDAPWLADLRRVWEPEHPAVERLLRLLDQVMERIIKIGEHGRLFESTVFGKDWNRFQNIACAAVLAARAQLAARPTTTLDRLRILGALHGQLDKWVPQAAPPFASAALGPHAAPWLERMAAETGKSWFVAGAQ